MEPTYKKTAKYEIVKNQLLSMIDSGELKPGDRIPSEQELADEFSVSVSTTRKALLDLARDGVICRIKKKGTFVSEPADVSPKSAPGEKVVSFLLPLCARSDNKLMQYVHGAQNYFSAHGYSMLIEATEDKIVLENMLIDQIIEKRPAGLLLFPTNPAKNAEYFTRLRQSRIPFVLIDRYPEDFPVNTVTCNNFDGAFQATEHLIQLGHEKILFVTCTPSNQAEKVRHNGYCHAMETHNLPENFPVLTCWQKEEICQQIRSEHFTALVCANDYAALESLKSLTEAGITVPGDVSVIGFDGQEATRYVTPALTTVIQPFYEIGAEAARRLVELIETSTKYITHTVLPVTLDIRQSTVQPGDY